MSIFNSKEIVIRQMASDSYRTIISVALVVALLTWTSDAESISANLHIIGLCSAFSIATALLSHITRRLLFPYLDLQELINEAKREPMASAVVFLSVCLVLSTMIYASSAFFSH